MPFKVFISMFVFLFSIGAFAGDLSLKAFVSFNHEGYNEVSNSEVEEGGWVRSLDEDDVSIFSVEKVISADQLPFRQDVGPMTLTVSKLGIVSISFDDGDNGGDADLQIPISDGKFETLPKVTLSGSGHDNSMWSWNGSVELEVAEQAPPIDEDDELPELTNLVDTATYYYAISENGNTLKSAQYKVLYLQVKASYDYRGCWDDCDDDSIVYWYSADDYKIIKELEDLDYHVVQYSKAALDLPSRGAGDLEALGDLTIALLKSPKRDQEFRISVSRAISKDMDRLAE